MKLEIGMDVSGNIKYGNYLYLAIVIGTPESLALIMKSLNYNQLHFSQIYNKKNRDAILSNLQFNGKDNIAFCIRLDRKHMINRIANSRKAKQKNIRMSTAIHTYNYLLFKDIREPIEEFLNKHNQSLSDTVIQCDGDCREFLQDNGLHYTSPGIAHQLADIVAWANNRGREPFGVHAIDHTKKIYEKLKKIIK